MPQDKYDILAHEALAWFEGWLREDLTKMDKEQIEIDIAKVFRNGEDK